MVSQVLELRVCLAAALAAIGSQACMCAPVLAKNRGISEALATVSAGVGPLARVTALVDLELGERTVGLGAMRTPEWQLACVRGQMHAQAYGLHEAATALWTWEGLLTRVAAPVAAELGCCLIRLGAQWACIRPRLCH